MSPKFNINRPKVTDDEIRQRQDFGALVEQFKKQSLKKARGDESWWKNRKITYTAAIAGITVLCTITLQALKSKQPKASIAKHDKINTPLPKNTTTTFIHPPARK